MSHTFSFCQTNHAVKGGCFGGGRLVLTLVDIVNSLYKLNVRIYLELGDSQYNL